MKKWKFIKLKRDGKCRCCNGIIPKDTKVMRIPAPRCEHISICSKCISEMNEFLVTRWAKSVYEQD